MFDILASSSTLRGLGKQKRDKEREREREIHLYTLTLTHTNEHTHTNTHTYTIPATTTATTFPPPSAANPYLHHRTRHTPNLRLHPINLLQAKRVMLSLHHAVAASETWIVIWQAKGTCINFVVLLLCRTVLFVLCFTTTKVPFFWG